MPGINQCSGQHAGSYCLVLCFLLTASTCIGQVAAMPAARHAYFGDLHIHTQNSFDAFLFNSRATPDDAYNYAQGKAILHPAGYSMQLQGGPLDFAAVTDHAELMGLLPILADPDGSLADLEVARQLASPDRKDVVAAIQTLLQIHRFPARFPLLSDIKLSRGAWRQTADAAERHNKPGKFTTFIGYEFSPAPGNQNLHRNVIFKSGSVPALPYSSLLSDNPEHLWRWMDDLREKGIEALAIPHNANVSNGLMFQRTDWDGDAIDTAYAAQRMRNEPLVEVSQVKGTSETHPLLSPNDEWAAFELYDTLIASTIVSKKSGGFVRQAYRTGLELAQAGSGNPFQFGLIGSSDTHNGGGAIEESRYTGKVGTRDGMPVLRGSVPVTEADEVPANLNPGFSAPAFSQWNAAGLAGVWAEENTREALYSAFRRKETFATSGPRIQVRFFAGNDYPEDLPDHPDMIDIAYHHGVAMGGTLATSKTRKPRFLVWASRDPYSAGLQRLQIIKGWVEDGKSAEQVVDVACSDDLAPDSATHRCPDNGATVNLTDCSFSAHRGDPQLMVLWSDPDFDAEQSAFYYVRVIENPTCRWSTWDALRAGVNPNPDLEVTIQERAWSSPIWLAPE
jgi:Protein of unknown function (DUF3604)